jgi:hypothetical protein
VIRSEPVHAHAGAAIRVADHPLASSAGLQVALSRGRSIAVPPAAHAFVGAAAWDCMAKASRHDHAAVTVSRRDGSLIVPVQLRIAPEQSHFALVRFMAKRRRVPTA